MQGQRSTSFAFLGIIAQCTVTALPLRTTITRVRVQLSVDPETDGTGGLHIHLHMGYGAERGGRTASNEPPWD